MTLSLLLAAVLAIAIPAPTAPTPPSSTRASGAHVASFAQHAGGPAPVEAGSFTLSDGRVDARGCPNLVVRVDGRKVGSIPSHRSGCSSSTKHVQVFGRYYFDWSVTWTTGDGRDAVTKRRADLWVTDGTRAGTQRITTVREQSGRRVPTCESRWARAGYRAIAGAQWCWDHVADAWVSGSIAILIDGRLARHLPVPRMRNFRMAGRRIVTTGEDRRGREPWVHDGQMTGIDLRPGPKGSNPHAFVDLGKKVQFVANDGNGRGIWVSDGTVAGTHLVRRLP